MAAAAVVAAACTLAVHSLKPHEHRLMTAVKLEPGKTVLSDEVKAATRPTVPRYVVYR